MTGRCWVLFVVGCVAAVGIVLAAAGMLGRPDMAAAGQGAIVWLVTFGLLSWAADRLLGGPR